MGVGDSNQMHQGTTRKSSQLKLLNYSTAASLALTAGLTLPPKQVEANGYTCVEPEITINQSGVRYLFDFDTNGDKEFWISYQSGLAMGKFLDDGGDVGAGVVLSGGHAGALNSGISLSVGKVFGTLNFLKAMISSSSGPWINASEKYLGLKFTLSSNTHYGWARISANANGSVFTVHKYCYNTTSGGSIPTGQSPTAVALHELSVGSGSAAQTNTLAAALLTAIAGLWWWVRRRLSSR